MENFFSNPVYVVEGFDMVGKSFFMNYVMSDYKVYHATHDLTDETVGRHNSWTIGYGVMDFLSQVGTDNLKVVIDRGVSSSFVYKRLYGMDAEVCFPGELTIDRVVDWYSKNEFFKSGVNHIHVCHLRKASARQIFEKSKTREVNPNALSAQMDRFSDFDEYWKTYLKAEELFTEVYDKLDIEPIIVKTYPGGFVINYPNGFETTVRVRL